ncbi:F0F1 ATP synthase subunit delta [Candidatus Daviesbacteria bacterium]|nr:F0F1 ATP synthase subunit delta [Candidatus Daviesbacteria bacterium]
MKKNKLLQKTIKKLVDASFKDGKIVESQVIKAIKLLKSQSTPQAILSLAQYLTELKRIERKHTMYLETIIPLSTDQLRKAKKIVEKKNKITKVVTSINPQILGGFKLQVGDEVWDESLLSKINQVKEVISGRFNSSN